MPQFIPSAPGSSAFPQSQLAQALGLAGMAGQAGVDMYQSYQKAQALQKPLREVLGGNVPPTLEPYANVPIGKIMALKNAFGGNAMPEIFSQKTPLFYSPAGQGQGASPASFGIGKTPEGSQGLGFVSPETAVSALKSQGGGTQMWYLDPKTGNISPQQTPGSIPTPLKPPAAVSAVQKQTTGLGPKDIITIADQVQKGDIQAMERLPAFGPNSPRSKVIAELAHRGIDITKIGLDVQAKKDYLRTVNSPGFQNTLKLLHAVGPNMDKVVSMSDDIQRFSIRPLNMAQLKIMRDYRGNDPQGVKMAAYAAATTEVADQVAKILQGGGTGSGTSDAKLKQANDLFSGTFTPPQVKQIAITMKSLLQERENALKTNTMLNLESGPTMKKDPKKRFAELMKQPGMTKAKAMKMMMDEGH